MWQTLLQNAFCSLGLQFDSHRHCYKMHFVLLVINPFWYWAYLWSFLFVILSCLWKTCHKIKSCSAYSTWITILSECRSNFFFFKSTFMGQWTHNDWAGRQVIIVNAIMKIKKCLHDLSFRLHLPCQMEISGQSWSPSIDKNSIVSSRKWTDFWTHSRSSETD